VSTLSALYVGRVTHHRLRPRRHSLAYRTYWLLLDLDEIDEVSRRLRLFSRNRFNLFSFYDRDHGSGEAPLRQEIERHLADAGIDLEGGPIRLLAMPRLLGYVFNPISVYFCHRRDGALAALIYQVHNTFSERHSYLIAVTKPANGPLQQTCAKRFHVSPFLGMDMRYDFNVTQPGKRVAVTVRGSDAAGDIIVATLSGAHAPLTDRQLVRLFVTYPLLTAKVTLGIHWEALRLWLKGLRVYAHPAPPKEAVTLSPPEAPRRAA
jgi:hypothetical protein